jgi:hypothetical protein
VQPGHQSDKQHVSVDHTKNKRTEVRKTAERTGLRPTGPAQTKHQLYTNYTPTIHQLYTNYTPTIHQLYTNYTPTIHQLKQQSQERTTRIKPPLVQDSNSGLYCSHPINLTC